MLTSMSEVPYLPLLEAQGQRANEVRSPQTIRECEHSRGDTRPAHVARGSRQARPRIRSC